MGLVANLVLATLLGLILREHVDADLLGLWVAAIIAIVFVRALSVYQYQRAGRRSGYTPLWRNVFLAGVVTQGAAWGFSVWIFGPFTEIDLPVFISFTLGGLTAGAAALMGSMMVVYLSYLVVMIVPLCLWFVGRADEVSLIMGGMLVFYMGVAISAALVYHRTFISTILLTNQLAKARETAEEANRAKTRFISSMGHELRTPLNAILGFTQLLKLDARQSDEQRSNLDEVHKAGEHLLQLINDLLDIVRLESGQLRLAADEVNLSQLVRESVAMIKPIAAQYQVELEDASDDQAYTVVGDFLRLKQVLLNLLSNGCKYNRRRGLLQLRTERHGVSAVRITVRDSGYGIPLDRQHEVFQSYNRIGYENSTIEGTGIGLSIAKQLMEKMGGKIAFESHPGVGSTFWLELPLAKHSPALAMPGHVENYSLH
ncbi:MAG: HAMP domain-containing sensor histidine kinase [Pseudomonadota bacterium]|nr:HAMP domain-containing sensor histidine kinase [Pseudomonadota bacterium]